jgi:hypothetical protein
VPFWAAHAPRLVAIEAAALYSVAAMVAETRILAGRTSAKMELIGMPRAVESETRYAVTLKDSIVDAMMCTTRTAQGMVIFTLCIGGGGGGGGDDGRGGGGGDG